MDLVDLVVLFHLGLQDLLGLWDLADLRYRSDLVGLVDLELLFH